MIRRGRQGDPSFPRDRRSPPVASPSFFGGAAVRLQPSGGTRYAVRHVWPRSTVLIEIWNHGIVWGGHQPHDGASESGGGTATAQTTR